ncbi:MAG: ATP-dependent Clp protease ATP-binding subunit [Candidatus Obscuribacterales bacterium]|nr:ATP-dependent Clp protease ATP-binding subunit [Candidatus Obscuribacterales bacterium]
MLDINGQLRKALAEANAEAQRIGRDYIDSISLVLGIFKEGQSRAAQLMSVAGLLAPSLRLLSRSQATPESLYDISLPDFSGRVTLEVGEAISLAGTLAKKHNLDAITPEVMLLALLQHDAKLKIDLPKANVKADRIAYLETELRSFITGGDAEAEDGDTESDAEAEGEAQGTSVNDKKKPKSKTPMMDLYCIDLMEMAKKGKITPVIGRQREIKRAMQILGCKTKCNPIFIGEAGVGKTALVEGLALRIFEGKVPKRLKNKRLVILSLTNLLAGASAVGAVQSRTKALLAEVKKVKNVIMFMDEIHTVIGAGGTTEGSLDVSNILKPALARGEISVIGATTLAEYRKFIEKKDLAFTRRFPTIMLEPPTVAETIEILKGLRKGYEDHHKVTISDEAIVRAAEMAERYIQDRFQPDKSIDLIDEAASMLALEEDLAAEDGVDGEQHKEAEAAAKANGGFASGLFDIGSWFGGAKKQAAEVAAKKEDADKGTEAESAQTRPVVTAEHIAQVISLATGIPLFKLSTDQAQRLLDMEKEIHRKVIGQEEAVTAVSRAIRRNRSGLGDPNRPQGTFIFIGPTGVGKTHLVKSLQDFLYGNDDLIQIDMSEFMERHEVSRMIGAPPGYIGYEEGGRLVEAVRRRPYSVVLLDEIEKAHEDVFNVLLQVMEEGNLTAGDGRKADFSNTVLVMTSNIGATYLQNVMPDDQEGWERAVALVKGELEARFRPEFLNRVDEIVFFRKLDEKQVAAICDLEVEKIRQRLSPRQITLNMDDSMLELLFQKGFDLTYGARPMRRAIQRYLSDPLSEALLAEKVHSGKPVLASFKDGEAVFEQPADEPVTGSKSDLTLQKPESPKLELAKKPETS